MLRHSDFVVQSPEKQIGYPNCSRHFRICNHNYNTKSINTLNAELNPIYHLLALLGAHPILHISRIRVNPKRTIHLELYRQFYTSKPVNNTSHIQPE